MQPKDLHGGLAFFFEQDHRDCDARWADVEELLDADDIEMAREAWTKYESAMHRHLTMEEEVLFPAFEAKSGEGGSGPVAALKMEHQQMRKLLAEIGRAIGDDDADRAMDRGDMLMVLVQQHGDKEEQKLYPAAESLLEDEWDELSETLVEYGGSRD